MAVVSVKTLHDGWSGSFTFREVPAFSVVYLVEVDDPEDGNLLVVDADGIPKIGSAYSVGQDFHAGVRCKSLSTAPVAGTRNLWQVTASYGKSEKGDDPTDGVTEDGEATDDPLKFAVSMSYSSTRVTRDAILGTYLGQYHENGAGAVYVQQGFNDGNAPPEFHDVVECKGGFIDNGRAITNSVFRPFDPPPQMEYNRMNVKIKWNQLNSPRKLLPFINSVNSKYLIMNVFYHWDDEFGLGRASSGQVHIPPYTGRIMGITVTPSKTNGIGFHDCELEIEIDKVFRWRLEILDRGYATLNADKSFSTSAGGTGVPVTGSDITEDGFANREPVLLDGKGQELVVTDQDAVYLVYGVYCEMDWHDIDLNQPKRLKDLDN